MKALTPYELEPLVFTETEVATLLRVHRTTIRAQAMQPGTALNECVIYLTPSRRVYPRAAIYRIAGFVQQADEKAA